MFRKIFSLSLWLLFIPSLALAMPIESSGVDLVNIDKSVRPQDDFYQYANGLWLESAEIPADKASWGAFNILREHTLANLKAILEDLNNNQNLAAGSDAYKIKALYQSFMDESTINQAAYHSLEPLFKEIMQIKNYNDLSQVFAKFNRLGINTPIGIAIHQDNKNSSLMVADLYQSGTNLPDRDYYLKTNDKKLMAIKAKYQDYIAELLNLAKVADSKLNAKEIVNLETKLAKYQWAKVENRNPQKTYNKYLVNDLRKLGHNIDWKAYLKTANITPKVNYVIIAEPSYFKGLNQLINQTSIKVWQEYLTYQVLNAFAPDLNQSYSTLSFKFYGTTLSGVPVEEPRYKRAIYLVEGEMGNPLGKFYVEKYFPAEYKAKMELLVHNLIKAYSLSIESLTWMSPKTKVKAQEKLHAMLLKIAYPDKWRDYNSLEIKANDLIGNILRSNQFNYDYEVNKLGQPVDKTEWGMTPQTVNAYYNPELNEIVFPAAILQAPFFNPQADMAANYGGIGAVIGHEISHGFDDQGSQYDKEGNLKDWMSKKDHQEFKAKTQALVKQYSKYSPLAGYYVNGELTLGENIADNSGLEIAYQAYLLSLNGESAPVIDGLTGAERFYLSFAQIWRNKMRDNTLIMLLKSDPHSPASVRGSATLRNQAGFYNAFKVESKDKMYLAPLNRVVIW